LRKNKTILKVDFNAGDTIGEAVQEIVEILQKLNNDKYVIQFEWHFETFIARVDHTASDLETIIRNRINKND